MNRVILIGRLTRDVDIRKTTGENATSVARYTLAVDRRFKRDGEQTADFISCVAFGRNADFAENYLYKGMKIAIEGRIQTGSYEKQDGTKVYTTDVIIESQEFVEKKGAAADTQPEGKPLPENDEFMQIPEGVDEELPFN